MAKPVEKVVYGRRKEMVLLVISCVEIEHIRLQKLNELAHYCRIWRKGRKGDFWTIWAVSVLCPSKFHCTNGAIDWKIELVESCNGWKLTSSGILPQPKS